MEPSGRYVAPDGDGSGTPDDPMGLTQAIKQPGEVWMLSGVYAGDLSITTNNLALRSAPGHWAIIDGAIDVRGDGVVLKNLEIMYSGWPGRISAQIGSNPTDLPLKNLSVYGPNTRILNCIIHDLAGFGWWGPAIHSEVYGCIIYSIGWWGPDRGHGHGIYTQNNTGGRKAFKNCITWGHYSTCGKVYSATNAPLKHYDIEGLICGPCGDSRFLVGSDDGSTEDVTVSECMTFGAAIQFGDALVTSSAAFDHCYIVHDKDIPLVLSSFATLTGYDNTIVGGDGADQSYRVVCKINNQRTWQIDRNAYYYTGPNALPFRNEGVGDHTFAQWQAATGLDANSTYIKGTPAQNKVVVQPNEYQEGRYHVAIYNWEALSSIPAPIAGRYTNAQNREESVVLEQGEPLPMDGWTTATPIGASAPIAEWDSRFGVFLVEA
jgi:hypothetical protein